MQNLLPAETSLRGHELVDFCKGKPLFVIWRSCFRKASALPARRPPLRVPSEFPARLRRSDAPQTFSKRSTNDISPRRSIASANTKRFAPKKVDSIAPIAAPSALATIRSIANGTVVPRGDCMTTTVAIAAQYASGNPPSRPSNIEIVAASAVRKACDSDGRFSRFQVQSFMAANHLRI